MKRAPQKQLDIKSNWRLYRANLIEKINKTTSNTTGTSFKVSYKNMVLKTLLQDLNLRLLSA